VRKHAQFRTRETRTVHNAGMNQLIDDDDIILAEQRADGPNRRVSKSKGKRSSIFPPTIISALPTSQPLKKPRLRRLKNSALAVALRGLSAVRSRRITNSTRLSRRLKESKPR